MSINTVQEVAEAIDRLSRRDSKALATFIVSLAQDAGPIGEQVRTFVVGDDIDRATVSLEERIESLGEHGDRQERRGREVGQRLELILDAVETLVMPADPKRAFELLVLVVESDGTAMENCGDDGYAVACAFERAAGLIARAAQSLPRAEVERVVKKLLADDGYGVRSALAQVLRGVGESS